MMPWLIPSVIATAAGTAILTVCFAYVYFLDRKPYLKVWAISWAVYFIRYIFLLAMLLWQKTPCLLIGNQLATLMSGVLLLYGSYLFINKKFPRSFLYLSVLGVLWIFISILNNYSFLVMSLPTFSFLAYIYVWTGFVFFKASPSEKKEASIVGTGFILWGIHKANYPFLQPVVWFAPWGYLFAALIEFTVALGLLLVYFRKTRNELEASESKLAESRNVLENILETTLSGYWDWNIPEKTEYLSPAFKKMFGYEDHELPNVPESWQKLIFQEDLPGVLTVFDRHVASKGKAPFYNEVRYRHKNGSTIWVICSGYVIKWAEDGSPIRMVGCHVNITDQKQAENEREKLKIRLTQAQKMESIGTLAGGIAHDFNNILYPIVGHTEMLMEDLSEENSSIRNSLNEIYTSALRARDLVQQILAFARQEKNELKLMKMQPIIVEAMKLIRSTIPTTISITQQLNPDCGPVTADPTQIHQIVMNLATNAYHAMEEKGGELNVTLKEIELGEDDLINPDMKPGLYACLSFIDTGRGMNKDVRDRIFEPFFTTKEPGKGTGMGLSVVHGIVKAMKGVIQVYSEPGKGTEFLVYLPVVGKASEKQESTTEEPIPGGCERVLLVDDEEIIVAMERQVLERLGYRVVFCNGSMEALEAFRAAPDQFDLVITDLAMPNMPGDKLVGELIRIRPDIPVLLCTGFSETMTTEKIKSLGIKGLVLKPIIIKDLAKKIREVLDQ